MKHLLQITLFALVIFSTLSCGKEEVKTTTDFIYSVSVNGGLLTGESDTDYKVRHGLESTFEGFEISFYELSGSNTQSRTVTILFQKSNAGEIEEGDEFFSGSNLNTGTEPAFHVLASYMEVDLQSKTNFGESENLPGRAYVKVTDIDRGNSTISGIFNFNIKDDESDEKYIGEDGIFTDLKY